MSKKQTIKSDGAEQTTVKAKAARPKAKRAKKSARLSPLARSAARYDELVAKLDAARYARDAAEKATMRLAVAVEKAHGRLKHALDSTDSRAASGPKPKAVKAKGAKAAKPGDAIGSAA